MLGCLRWEQSVVVGVSDKWQAEHQFTDFICYDRLQPWRHFTGLRNELDYVITADGVRLLGTIRKPMTLQEVYAAKEG